MTFEPEMLESRWKPLKNRTPA